MRVTAVCIVLGSLTVLVATRQTPGLTAWEKPIAPGVVYRAEVDSAAPRMLHAVRFSPGNPALRWQTELAKGTIDEDGTKGRETPNKMVERTGALVGINGDFFSFDHGAPIGLTVRNGELVNSPVRSRAVFGWGPKDTAFGLGKSKVSMLVAPASREIAIDSVNQPIGENGFGLYTPAQGYLRPREGATVVLLDTPNVVWSPSTAVNATVTAITTDTKPFLIPTGKAALVVSGSKKPRIAGISVDGTVALRFETSGFDWERIDNVIGGGPFLLKDKEVAIDGEAEGFDAAFTDKRHPRSAIGRTAEGDIWLVAVEGRQSHSVGATLPEMANIMKRLGCVDAMNLDGGGSTALVVDGLTVSRTSDASEREVSNGVLLFGAQMPSPSGRLRLVLGGKVSDWGTVQARVEIDRKPVPPLDVLWTSRGAAVVDPNGYIQFTAEGSATISARVYGQILSTPVAWKKSG